MGLLDPKGKIELKEDAEKLRINFNTEEAGILIGKGGGNLRALQHLLLLVVSRRMGLIFKPGSFVFDVNNYHKDRERYLVALAKNTAQEVIDRRRSKELQPMPASERRIVHVTLADYSGIKTESVGQRDERRVIIGTD